jgi:hypothetical protein
MLPEVLTTNQLSLVISQAAAPAFLLGAVASFLSVLVRATLVNRAIYWAVASGITSCLLMIAAFGSAYFGFRHEPGAAILFTLSLALFTFSLISFAREVKFAMKVTDFG